MAPKNCNAKTILYYFCCSHRGIKEVKLISVVVTLSLTYSTFQCRSKQSTLEQTSSKLNERLPGSLSVHWGKLALFPSLNYPPSKPSLTCHIHFGLNWKNKKESAFSMALLQLMPHIQRIDCLTVRNYRISVSMNFSTPTHLHQADPTQETSTFAAHPLSTFLVHL